jgi:hypothetical protein
MQAVSREQADSQVKPLQRTPPYTTMHVLTALFFQVQAEAHEQQESQVKSLHHTPPLVSVVRVMGTWPIVRKMDMQFSLISSYGVSLGATCIPAENWGYGVKWCMVYGGVWMYGT